MHRDRSDGISIFSVLSFYFFTFFLINIPALFFFASSQLVPRASIVRTSWNTSIGRFMKLPQRPCSAWFIVARCPDFWCTVLEREPHYSVHPVICPFVVCPGPTRGGDSTTFSERCCLGRCVFGAIIRVRTLSRCREDSILIA